MAKAIYKSFGEVIYTTQIHYGFCFNIKLKGEAKVVLPYVCAVYSSNDANRRFGLDRLAKLARACHIERLIEPEALHGIEIVVYHDATAVAKLEPVWREPQPPAIKLLSICDKIKSWFYPK